MLAELREPDQRQAKSGSFKGYGVTQSRIHTYAVTYAILLEPTLRPPQREAEFCERNKLMIRSAIATGVQVACQGLLLPCGTMTHIHESEKEHQMAPIRVGVQLRPQHTSYATLAEAARQCEALGVDTIFTWDHFFPLSGDPQGNHFEGWTLLTALAAITSRVEIGHLVTCNSYRNPALLSDMAKTVDHISNGRLILGIGAGWFQRDYDEYGYTFGTAPERLRALREALPIIRHRWEVDVPPPIRNPIPILIGGGGEKVTLRLAAQHAQIWHGFGPLEQFQHKSGVLDEWCRTIGRDPAEIERSVSVNSVSEADAYVAASARHLILGIGAPWDLSEVEQLVRWRDAQR